MTERLHIKPARPGEVLRDPHTRRALPDEGGLVPDTTFWRRRLADGDAVEVQTIHVSVGDERIPITVDSRATAEEMRSAIADSAPSLKPRASKRTPDAGTPDADAQKGE